MRSLDTMLTSRPNTNSSLLPRYVTVSKGKSTESDLGFIVLLCCRFLFNRWLDFCCFFFQTTEMPDLNKQTSRSRHS